MMPWLWMLKEPQAKMTSNLERDRTFAQSWLIEACDPEQIESTSDQILSAPTYPFRFAGTMVYMRNFNQASTYERLVSNFEPNI